MKRSIYFILLIIIIVPSVYAADRVDLTQGQITLLNNLQNKGLLSIESNLNKAFINPSLWQNMKYNIKKDFAATLSIYCGNEKGTYLYWVKIYDQYSGKILAKYSRSWGFKVY